MFRGQRGIFSYEFMNQNQVIFNYTHGVIFIEGRRHEDVVYVLNKIREQITLEDMLPWPFLKSILRRGITITGRSPNGNTIFNMEGRMPKYQTEPIDYTGCHPIIAKHLQQNLAINCIVCDNRGANPPPTMIRKYNIRSDYPYCGDSGSWKHAEPIEIKVMKTVVKPASVIVKWLEDSGYKVVGNGFWVRTGCVQFNPIMFQECGKEPTKRFNWNPAWLEEVEA